MTAVEHRLRELDLFSGFSAAELAALARLVAERRCLAGEILCREGEPGDEMYVLLAGRLRVFKEQRTIVHVEPVDYVGEMALIESGARSASVEVVEDATLLVLDREAFTRFVGTHPACLIHLTRNLCRRVRRDTELLAQEFQRTNILVHDMKNLLSVFVLLDRLAAAITDEDLGRCLAIMRQGRDDLAELMAEALANAKRLVHEPTRRTADLGPLVRQSCETLAAAHPALAGRHLVVEVARDLPAVDHVPAAIRRLLANLLANAGQMSPAGSTIRVALAPAAGGVRLTVTDQGPGVPPELRQRIFTPHFTTRQGGSGLGLASCRSIVEEHHGTIRVADGPGTGAVFIVELPAAGDGDG